MVGDSKRCTASCVTRYLRTASGAIIKRQLNERFCRGEQFPTWYVGPMTRTLPATEVEQLPVAPKIDRLPREANIRANRIKARVVGMDL